MSKLRVLLETPPTSQPPSQNFQVPDSVKAVAKSTADAVDQTRPYIEDHLPMRIKKALEVFDTMMVIKKLSEENPDVPLWEVQIAATAGTLAGIGTAAVLETAIIMATAGIEVGTLGSGTIAAFGIWYSGTVFTVQMSELAVDGVSNLVLDLFNDRDFWDSYLDPYATPFSVRHHRQRSNGSVAQLSMTQNDRHTEVNYNPGDGSVVEKSSVVQAIRDLKEGGQNYGPFFSTSKIVVSLADGQYTAYVGTSSGEVLDASNEYQPVELYGNPGNDTLRGGYGDDHHDGGRGDDDMRDEWGENRYYLQYANNGHDRIKDGERTGVLLLGGYAISGMSTREGEGRYKLERDDVDVYLTRVDANGNADLRGDSLVMTFDEAFEGASNSVLIEDFRSGDFGIHLPASYLTLPLTGHRTVLGTLSNSNVLALSLQADPNAPGSGGDYYPIYLNYAIYDGDGGVVKPLSRLAEAVNTIGTMPYGQIGKPKSLTLKNGNTVVTWLQTLAVDTGDGYSKWDDTRLFALIMNRDGVVIKAPFRVSQVTAPSTYEAGRLTSGDDYDIALLTGEEPGFAVCWPTKSYRPQPYLAIRSFSENGGPFTDDKVLFMDSQYSSPSSVRGVVVVKIASVRDNIFDIEWSNQESASVLNPGSSNTYTKRHITAFANGTIIPDMPYCAVGMPVVWGKRIAYYSYAGDPNRNNMLTACDTTTTSGGGMLSHIFHYNYTGSIPAPGYIVAVRPLSNRRLFIELGGYSDNEFGSNYYRTGVYEITQNNGLRSVVGPSVVPLPVPYIAYGSGYFLMCDPYGSILVKKGSTLLHVQACNWENNIEDSPYLPTGQIINFNPIAGYDKPAEIRTVGYSSIPQVLEGDDTFNNRFYVNTIDDVTIIPGPKNNKIVFEVSWAADQAQRITIPNYRPTDVIDLGIFADRMVYMSQPSNGSRKGYIYVHSYTKDMYDFASEEDYQNAPYLTIEVEFSPFVQPVLLPTSIIKTQGVGIQVSTPPFALPPRSPVVTPVPVPPPVESPMPTPPTGEPNSEPGFTPEPGFAPIPDSEPMGQPGQGPVPTVVPPTYVPPDPGIYTGPSSGGVASSATRGLTIPSYLEWYIAPLVLGKVVWNTAKLQVQNLLSPANTNAEPKPTSRPQSQSPSPSQLLKPSIAIQSDLSPEESHQSYDAAMLQLASERGISPQSAHKILEEHGFSVSRSIENGVASQPKLVLNVQAEEAVARAKYVESRSAEAVAHVNPGFDPASVLILANFGLALYRKYTTVDPEEQEIARQKATIVDSADARAMITGLSDAIQECKQGIIKDVLCNKAVQKADPVNYEYVAEMQLERLGLEQDYLAKLEKRLDAGKPVTLYKLRTVVDALHEIDAFVKEYIAEQSTPKTFAEREDARRAEQAQKVSGLAQ